MLIIKISSFLLKFLISWKMKRLSISGDSQCGPRPIVGGSARATILKDKLKNNEFSTVAVKTFKAMVSRYKVFHKGPGIPVGQRFWGPRNDAYLFQRIRFANQKSKINQNVK